MKYDDLLSVPYKEGGRDKNGMDCCGWVLELERRHGTPMIDPLELHVNGDDLEKVLLKTNIKEISQNEIRYGDIMQCIYNGNLHIGFILDKKLVSHMTEKGPRETPLVAFRNKKYGRIYND